MYFFRRRESFVDFRYHDPENWIFHTVTTNVIFGKFSTFSAFSKISKTAPTIFLKLSQHMLDNENNLIPKFY